MAENVSGRTEGAGVRQEMEWRIGDVLERFDADDMDAAKYWKMVAALTDAALASGSEPAGTGDADKWGTAAMAREVRALIAARATPEIERLHNDLWTLVCDDDLTDEKLREASEGLIPALAHALQMYWTDNARWAAPSSTPAPSEPAAPSGRVISQAWREWLESKEGQKCTDGGATGAYLRNRLERAFLAGAALYRHAPASEPSEPDGELVANVVYSPAERTTRVERVSSPSEPSERLREFHEAYEEMVRAERAARDFSKGHEDEFGRMGDAADRKREEELWQAKHRAAHRFDRIRDALSTPTPEPEEASNG